MDIYKKPLLLNGISGCGKTYTALEFGKSEYKNLVYFDCQDNLELSYVIEKNTTPDKLVRGLAAISLETIMKEDTLIIFDNVTEKIITAVKKQFGGNEYHIIMITSNNKLVKRHKAEGVNYKKMDLVSFPEYLKYVGKEQMIDFITDSFKSNKPMAFQKVKKKSNKD